MEFLKRTRIRSLSKSVHRRSLDLELAPDRNSPDRVAQGTESRSGGTSKVHPQIYTRKWRSCPYQALLEA